MDRNRGNPRSQSIRKAFSVQCRELSKSGVRSESNLSAASRHTLPKYSTNLAHLPSSLKPSSTASFLNFINIDCMPRYESKTQVQVSIPTLLNALPAMGSRWPSLLNPQPRAPHNLPVFPSRGATCAPWPSRPPPPCMTQAVI